MEHQLIALIRLSLNEPRKAAQKVLALSLDRDVLWTALALVGILNTLLVTLVIETSGSNTELPGYFDRPLALFVLITGLMVVFIHAVYWAGLVLGGQGSLMDVLALVVWFQVLRALAQVAIIVFSFLLPAAGFLLSLVVAIWGLWIFLNFLAVALNLNSLYRGIAVLAMAALGLILGLAVLVTLIGGLTQGVIG